MWGLNFQKVGGTLRRSPDCKQFANPKLEQLAKPSSTIGQLTKLKSVVFVALRDDCDYVEKTVFVARQLGFVNYQSCVRRVGSVLTGIISLGPPILQSCWKFTR